jgi:hypothetical protein
MQVGDFDGSTPFEVCRATLKPFCFNKKTEKDSELREGIWKFFSGFFGLAVSPSKKIRK